MMNTINKPANPLMDDVKQWIVLVVDDEPDNRMIAQQLLLFYGATVYTAENGKQGLEMLTALAAPPTVILLDISMPLMNGFDMLKMIRSHTLYHFTPVVALTAHVLPADLERIKAAGFNGFIGKPFNFGMFLNEIRKSLTPPALT